MKGKKLKAIIVTIALVSMVTNVGCKPSPALQKTVIDQNSKKVDKNNKTKLVDNNKANKNRDDKLSPKDKDENSQDKRDMKNDLSVKGEVLNDSSAADVKYTSSSTSDASASSGSGGQPSGGSTPNQSQPTYSGATRHEIDPFGNEQTIPENVDKVSAVGAVSGIVQMLGGGKRLIASSASFVENQYVKSVFADENINEVGELWDGDGSGAISDDKFQQLLTLSPQVCFYSSGSCTFTQDQLNALAQKNIVALVLPKLNTSSNLKATVKYIGQVLGDKSSSGGLNAPQLADVYNSYYDSVISEIGSKIRRVTSGNDDYDNDIGVNGRKELKTDHIDESDSSFNGKYSIYISNWESYASYRISNSRTELLSGTGLAVTRTGYSYSSLSYYMSMAGIINCAAKIQDFASNKYTYVNPIITTNCTFNSSGNYSNNYDSNQILTLKSMDLSKNDGTIGIGCKDYLSIIVANRDIKQQMTNNKLWELKPLIRDSYSERHGFYDDQGTVIESSIIKDYGIYVNPTGVGSWADGSVESILEPIWLADKFQGKYSDSEVKQKVKQFYSKFYRCDLSDSQAESILDGE